MRLGCLPYLNVKPLVYTLEHGQLPEGWELVYAPPSQLARMLEAGEIAAAPVSSFATFRNPDFGICPGICIAADGPVKSVLLLTKKNPQDLGTVALDTSSLSGANMSKIILSDLFDSRPEFVRMDPKPVSSMLERCDAALVIGDPAMTCPKDGYQVIDLAEQWKRLTGLPAVFAVWAGKGITPELVTILHQAREAGLARVREIAGEESVRLNLPFEVCYDYLTNIMVYQMGDRESQGLAEFRRRATEHGLVDPKAGAL